MSKQSAAVRRIAFSFPRCKVLIYEILRGSWLGIKMTQLRRIGDSKVVGMDLQIIFPPIEIWIRPIGFRLICAPRDQGDENGPAFRKFKNSPNLSRTSYFFMIRSMAAAASAGVISSIRQLCPRWHFSPVKYGWQERSGGFFLKPSENSFVQAFEELVQSRI